MDGIDAEELKVCIYSVFMNQVLFCYSQRGKCDRATSRSDSLWVGDRLVSKRLLASSL